jgi:rubrerythrin
MLFEHLEEKEAVKKASLIEKNGYDFYAHLAERAEDRDIKVTLKKLASEEKRHMKVLEDKYYPEAGFGDLITNEEIDIEEYVNKTMDEKVFTLNLDMEKLVHTIDTVHKAILLAMHAERYTAEYFEGMAEKTSTEDGKKIYKELADEERKHARELEVLLESK